MKSVENISKINSILSKIVGGTLRRILIEKSNIYFGLPCIIESEKRIGIDIELNNKFYELKIFNPEKNKDTINLNKIWKGIFEHRVKYSTRNYTNSFTLLKHKTYSTYRNNKISKILTYGIEIDGFEFIGHILIYLEEGDVIEIERGESRIIEIRIHNQDEFSLSSIEEDYGLNQTFE